MRLSLFAAPLLALAVSACGTPTVEYQVSRCQTAFDNLDVLAAKQPHLSQEIHRKKAELGVEFEKVKGLQGEEGSKTIGAVCYRIEQYYSQLNPQPVQPTGTTAPGGKLGATPGQPVQPGQTPPPGGKLGGTPGQPAQPGAPTPAPAGDSGFGGGAAPAPGAPTPAPDSGFGGGAPAPAPGAPAPAPQGGGFGGQ